MTQFEGYETYNNLIYFSDLPYRTVQIIKNYQKDLLNKIQSSITDLQELDKVKIKNLVDEYWYNLSNDKLYPVLNQCK